MKKFSFKFLLTITILSLLLCSCSEKKQDSANNNNSQNSSLGLENSSNGNQDNNSSEQQNENYTSSNSSKDNPSSSSIDNGSSFKTEDSNNKSQYSEPSNSISQQQNDNQDKSQKISIGIDCINASNEKLYEKFGERVVPKNGIVLSEIFVDFKEGQTAYDVLKSVTRQNNIILSTKGFGEQIYISGINGLKEFDGGQTSGWLYTINGKMPDVGVGGYQLKNGDKIQLRYTVKIGDV